MADEQKQAQAQEQTQEQQQQQQPKGGDHIPTGSGEEEEQQQSGSGGLLSKIGDPVGNVLGTALRPIGAPLEKGLTGPLGNAIGGTTRPALGPLMGEDHEKSELLGGKNTDSYETKPESIAGKEQTGQNPLGLDQTGRWGFEGDDKK